MKTNKKIRLAAIVSAVALAGTITVYAAYDSGKDPIVSLSYINQVFKPELKTELSNSIKSELSDSIKSSVMNEVTGSIAPGIKKDLKSELGSELSKEIADSVSEAEARVKSELEEYFNSIYSGTFDALQAQLDALENEYTVVNLQKDQRLTADAACEFIVLSGNATVRSANSGSGIIDCTDGLILYDGQNVPVNHKLLVPDNGDGRGITATGVVKLLVKGGYTIG